MNEMDFKHRIKEIYDFIENHNIQSFYCAGYDYHPKVKLTDLLDPKKEIDPNFCIRLNNQINSWKQDRNLLEQRFPDYFVLSETIFRLD
jgi:hypothetical protein